MCHYFFCKAPRPIFLECGAIKMYIIIIITWQLQLLCFPSLRPSLPEDLLLNESLCSISNVLSFLRLIIIITIQGLIRVVSPQLWGFKAWEMSLLPNTETTHNSYAACGRKDNTKTAQKHKASLFHWLLYMGNQYKDCMQDDHDLRICFTHVKWFLYRMYRRVRMKMNDFGKL
jgi:hypothetical protein